MPWLSLPEYARRTSTPESTVRAMIRGGRLRAELEQRAPGDPRTVWRVWLDDPPEPATDASTGHPQPSSIQESAQPPVAATDAPALTTRLLEKLDERDETIATLYAENADLRERAGRAEAERDAERVMAAVLQAQLDQARRPWWRKLRDALIGS